MAQLFVATRRAAVRGNVAHLFVIALCASVVSAQKVTENALLAAVRHAPRSRAASQSIERLAWRGPAGWKALRTIITRCERDHPQVARRAARALVDGREPERIALIAEAYEASRAESVRGVLALGLAPAYPERFGLLLGRLLSGRPGQRELFEALARAPLPTAKVERCLAIEELAEAAYRVLKERGETIRPEQLAPLARRLAQDGLSPTRSRRFAAEPDFAILRALARVLAEESDERLRLGALCLLQETTGAALPPDSKRWSTWIDANQQEFAAPAFCSPGRIAAARSRAARYLRRVLGEQGKIDWQGGLDIAGQVFGTAVAVQALRAAGVPADDPAIRKALTRTLLVFDRTGAADLPPIPREHETMGLGLLACALESVDATAHRKLLQKIADRLAQGQLGNGQWANTCTAPKKERAHNRTTQYALLGLRAARRAGAKVPVETWQRAERHWRSWTNPEGGWNYSAPPDRVGKGQAQMTAVGLRSLAICIEALQGGAAAARLRADPVVRRALQYLGERLATAGLPRPPFAVHPIEGACAVTGTKRFRAGEAVFEWYERGAVELLAAQLDDGTFGTRSGCGRDVDTAYCLLFLERATRALVPPAAFGDVAIELAEGATMVPKPQPPAAERHTRKPVVLVRLQRTRLATRDHEVALRGRVLRTGTSLSVDGRDVQPDAHGNFTAPLSVEKARDVEVVALRAEVKQRLVVRVEHDTRPPHLELAGLPLCGVGRQALTFLADEPLEFIWIGRRLFPADGKEATAVVDLAQGKHTLRVRAVDRAGNAASFRFEVKAANRVLSLDGKGSVFAPLPDGPDRFTLECWARGEEPKSNRVLVGFGWHWSGANIHWHMRGWAGLPDAPVPHGVLFLDGRYRAVPAKPGRRWDRWTHLALTYDGKTARFFVNGRLQTKVEGTKYAHVTGGLYIGSGKMGGGTYWRFKGDIDEVRLSNVARYAVDFKPQKRFQRDDRTLLLFHFDSDTPDAFFDDSGHKRHGRPVGTVRLATVSR